MNEIAVPRSRQMLNKVPEITLYFWVIKILCTTVGETAADLLNENLGLGLTNTTYIMAAALIAVLVVQFRATKYVPGVYWLAVVLISVVGTLFSDNLVDNLGVQLQTTTIAFSVILACVFGAWYASERTLSVHTIVTTRREAFYWLAILFTFALGTSAGDLVAEKLELGYLPSVGIFAGAIAIVAVAHFALQAERDPRLLDRLHPDPAARRLDRRLPLAAGRRNRPRPGDDPDQPHLPQRDPRAGRLPDDLQARPDRRLAAEAGRIGHPPGRGAGEPRGSSSSPTRSRPTPALIDAVRERAAAGPGAVLRACPEPRQPAASTETAPTRSDGEQALKRIAAAARASRRGPRSRAGSPTAPTPMTTSSRSWTAAITGRSSSRRRPATSRTGCTSTCRERVAHLGYPLTTVTATA